jgi:cell wall-associated NlpC family hydrolase
MPATRAQAVRNALADRTNAVGMCLQQVRTWAGIPARYPSAIIAWEHTRHRVSTRTPPAGFFVFFRGGRFGHIALSLGNGRIRTTDWPRGRVGTTTISELERRWGYHYVGSSSDVNGVNITR